MQTSNLRHAAIFLSLISFFAFTWATLAVPQQSSHSLKQDFKSPPAGYGQVPFYWWNGDTLKHARLMWQLEQLHKAGVQGFAVSYHHTHPEADLLENRSGFGAYGRTAAGAPAAFSQPWWEIWNWFSGECGKRGMGVGLDDYTFNWPGNGYWPDEIADLAEMKNCPGFLLIADPMAVKGGDSLHLPIPSPAPFAVTAYPLQNRQWLVEKAISLLPFIREGTIHWQAPARQNWMVSIITTAPGHELHPDYGQLIIKHYFNQFVDHLDSAGLEGMNFFFQDELEYDLVIGKKTTWAQDMAQEFSRRKGYDVQPYLPALVTDIGPITPKIRLDYSDVMVSLAEERYFQPVHQWHADRNLIYGCDNNGRGLAPLQYGDYFRATSWFTAPGNDAPGRGLSFIQTKVSSSIAHLYQRPRVWLEAFHSMCWDSRPEWLTEQLDRHFLLGGNLLCLHGLYYSLYGGWFEWAPPCFHLHMPYWPHMQHWLKYAERLSFLLSQGRHVCDVAILYPVPPLQAGTSATPEVAFTFARKLYDAGIDFDFIDEASLQRALISDRSLHISHEHYRALVLADMSSIRFSTMQKIAEFHKQGGLVLAGGSLPIASDRIGRDDPQLQRLVSSMFSNSTPSSRRTSLAAGNDLDLLLRHLQNHLPLSCRTDDGPVHSLHRMAGDHHIYMVMDGKAGGRYFFNNTGQAELWDAWTGDVQPLPVIEQTAAGTWLRLPVNPPRSALVVFSPGQPRRETAAAPCQITHQVLDGFWQCELVPTRDNRWGDFRLPATNTVIGAEAPEFSYAAAESAATDWQQPEFDDSAWPLVRPSFGPQFWQLCLPRKADFDSLCASLLRQPFQSGAAAADRRHHWQPCTFSWRWGVDHQPGSQGYHGLKAKISDDFIIFANDGHYFFQTSFDLAKVTLLTLHTGARSPDRIWIDGRPVHSLQLYLNAGRHHLFFAYKNMAAIPFEQSPHMIDHRSRAAMVLVAADSNHDVPHPLSMRWYNMNGRIVFDPMNGQPHNDCFRFMAPPGLQAMHFKACGQARVWINGRAVTTFCQNRSDEWQEIQVRLDSTLTRASLVALQIQNRPGYYAGAVFPEPVSLTCGPGEIEAGDWSQLGVLKHYSGGMWYRRTVSIAEPLAARTWLDLGQVVATCEVWINDEKAGVLVNAPYRLDISRYVRKGENRLDVLVYNTLANHYQTIPSPYKGKPVSGLVGPVQLMYESEK